MILSPIGAVNMVKLIIIAVVALLLMLITIRMQELAKMWMGTAVIGAGQLVVGFGAFFGGFPTLFRPTYLQIDELNAVTIGYIGYCAAFLFFVIAGALNQRRLTKWQWVHDDQMDESISKRMIF